MGGQGRIWAVAYLLAGLTIVLLGSVSGSVSGSVTVRNDWLDGNYLTGHLVVQDGSGEILWTAPESPEDNVDLPADGFAGALWDRTHYVNASRLVRVDLFLKDCTGYNDPEPNYKVELRVGDRLFAAADGQAPIMWSTTPAGPEYSTPPDFPDGYCYRAFRMPAEMDILPRGASLELSLVPHDGTSAHKLGTVDNHASTILIPVFPLEEALFRFPELADYGTNPAPAPTDASEPTATITAAAFAAAPLVRLRGSPRRFAFLFVASLLFAGCLAGPGGSDGGSGLRSTADSRWDLDNETGLSNATHGSIIGIVRDDLGLALVGAHAALLGRSDSTTTAAGGRFVLGPLPAGSYNLRVDKPAYQQYEGPVQVAASTITRMDVVLVPFEAKGRDFRPHPHDAWGIDRSKELVNQDIVLAGGISSTSFQLPPPTVVLPGTRELEITVSWDSPKLLSMTMNLGSNVEETYFSTNSTSISARANGQTIHLMTTWEMTDVGHQRYSAWAPFVMDFEVPPGLFELENSADEYTISIRMIAHKGIVPVEPPHRDLWKGATQLTIAQNAGSSHPVVTCAVVCGPIDISTGQPRESQANLTWGLKKIIPPETEWLDVSIKQTRAMVPTDIDWSFSFKGALSPQGSYYDGQAVDNLPCPPEGPAPGMKPALPTSYDAAQRTWHFQIPLARDDPDPFYATRSNWCFYAEPVDLATFWADWVAEHPLFAAGEFVPDDAKPLFQLSVTAHREPLAS